MKSVVSGDTLVLVGKATNGPPPEITITLSYVQCPKIARGPSQTDEAFAWESREFLRALCVGKSVMFRVTQTVSSINRIFGDVLLNGIPVVKMVVENGWASLKEQRDREAAPESEAMYQELVLLNAAAKAGNIGIYNNDEVAKKASIRTIDWTVDAAKYFEGLLGDRKVLNPSSPVILEAVIEYIRDGASFRCYVPKDSCYVSFAFAGATCPRVNTPSSTSSENAAAPEPFAAQSKLFTECRLLNRRLDLAVQGVSSGRGEPMLLGTVLHPRGNITEQLLKAGLAKVADWTLALLPKAGVLALREAENEAKRERRGVWADAPPPTADPACRVFEATVVEILSGDTIVVLEGQVEKRVTFSSIRVPRHQARGGTSDPFAVECKEFVRQKLIGKSVVVSVEYQRGEGKDTRQFASVYYGASRQVNGKGGAKGQDIALQLVQEGLAVTVRHRGDEPRAMGYDMLMVEEVQAVQKKKGMHGPQSKATAATSSNDVTSDPKKAKQVFATLSKDKTYKGVIEHVFTGSRYKVSIPAENITLQLSLSQVRTPAIVKNAPATGEGDDTKADGLEEGEIRENPLVKWVEAGKRYSRHTLLQRKVDIEISDMDRNGIMMGKVFVTAEANSSRPVAFSLVELGLASVDKYAERRGGHEITALVEVQNEAKADKRGMWIVPNAVPSTVKDTEAEEGDEEGDIMDDAATKNMFRVSLTEIYDGANFAVNFVDQPNEGDSQLLRGQMKLAEVEEMMRAFAKEALDGGAEEQAVATSKGTLLAIMHEDPSVTSDEEPIDQVWLRGNIEEKIDKDRVRVLFVDYGHRAVVPVKGLRALPEPLKHYAAQAVPCTLSFLRAGPVDTDGGVAAARALNSIAWGKPCLIKVHGRERSSSNGKAGGENKTIVPSKLEVSLYAVDSYSEEDLTHATNVGVKLVRHGFVRISAALARKERGGSRPNRRGGNKTIPRAVTTNETLRELEVAQDLAHKEHLRMWKYGHPGDSDDEDETPRGDKKEGDKDVDKK